MADWPTSRLGPEVLPPVSSADDPFYLFLPSLSSMQEHLMQDDGPVRSSQLPPGVLIEKEFGIFPLLSFSHQESSFPGPLPGSLGLPYPSSIMQLQQTRVTKETIKT